MKSQVFSLIKNWKKNFVKKVPLYKNFFSNLEKGLQAPGVVSSHPESSKRHETESYLFFVWNKQVDVYLLEVVG
jgi:hypothetical protein